MFGGLKKIAKKIVKAPKKAVKLVTNPVKTIKSLKSLPKRIYKQGIYDTGKNLQRGSTKILKALPIAGAAVLAGGGLLGGIAAGAGSALAGGKNGGSSGSSGSDSKTGITPEMQAKIDARTAPKSNQKANLEAYRANRKPVGGQGARKGSMANRNTPGRSR